MQKVSKYTVRIKHNDQIVPALVGLIERDTGLTGAYYRSIVPPNGWEFYFDDESLLEIFRNHLSKWEYKDTVMVFTNSKDEN